MDICIIIIVRIYHSFVLIFPHCFFLFFSLRLYTSKNSIQIFTQNAIKVNEWLMSWIYFISMLMCNLSFDLFYFKWIPKAESQMNWIDLLPLVCMYYVYMCEYKVLYSRCLCPLKTHKTQRSQLLKFETYNFGKPFSQPCFVDEFLPLSVWKRQIPAQMECTDYAYRYQLE